MIATAFGEWKNSLYPGRYRVERKMQFSGEAWVGKKVNDGSTSHQGLLGAHPEVLELYLSRKGQLWVQVTSLGVVAVARTHCILAAFPTLHQAEGRLGMELTPSGGLSGHTLTVAFPTVPKN